MVDVDPFLLYDIVVGLLGVVGVAVLLATHRGIRYPRFVQFVLLGFVLFLVGGPVIRFLLPSLEHFMHGFAALSLIAALGILIHEELRPDEWMGVVFEDPRQLRTTRPWMTPLDDEVLELFHNSELTLTPSIIAYNLDYHSKEVNRHLMELAEHGYLERVKRGKYRLTDRGELYLTGEPDEQS